MTAALLSAADLAAIGERARRAAGLCRCDKGLATCDSCDAAQSDGDDVPALLGHVAAQEERYAAGLVVASREVRELQAEVAQLRAAAAERGKLGEGFFDHGG